MADTTNELTTLIKRLYQSPPSDKAQKYISHFYNKKKKGNRIYANTNGNYGVYTISIQQKKDILESACSCYIGKYGGCHHVAALAHHYLAAVDSFVEEEIPTSDSIKDTKTLGQYIKGASLEDLLDELKATKGITQAAFGRSIGMSSQHISAVKKAESRNRHFKELGAIKLACLYVLERRKIKN